MNLEGRFEAKKIFKIEKFTKMAVSRKKYSVTKNLNTYYESTSNSASFDCLYVKIGWKTTEIQGFKNDPIFSPFWLLWAQFLSHRAQILQFFIFFKKLTKTFNRILI